MAGSSAPRPAAYAVESLRMTNNLGRGTTTTASSVKRPGSGPGRSPRLTRSYTWTHNVLAGAKPDGDRPTRS